MNHNLVQLFEEGTVVLPKRLFTEAKRLGISFVEFTLIGQLFACRAEGMEMPSPEELSNRLGLSETETIETTLGLLQKGLLAMENVNGSERYSLVPLYEKLMTPPEQETPNFDTINPSVFQQFERELGMMSPFQMEQIIQWLTIENISEELVLAALREAVYHNVRKMTYINQILRTWEREGIKTLEDLAGRGG
ncbi:DnaD domain protein [uncultured Exiguobacterium sp.]|uniref:DnaD domain-containing protein n=1 Tax=uncultured Exiguobacterium sp. TaxID=202669 RepID=UPI0025F02360|nr:DnaD domain protein [uncultured Exiguobacterium sp.]